MKGREGGRERKTKRARKIEKIDGLRMGEKNRHTESYSMADIVSYPSISP